MKKIFSLFLIHGKPSKKSKLTYRVRNGRQQCYILNHSIPDSPKQRACQSVFAQASAIINRIMAIPARRAYWEGIAIQSNIQNFTARKAAYAYYSKFLKPKLIANKQPLPVTAITVQHTPKIIENKYYITLLSAVFVVKHQLKYQINHSRYSPLLL